MKFGRIVPQVNGLRIDRRSQISDMAPYFQYGGHDVRWPLMLHMQQRPLSHRARVYSS